MKIFQPSTSSGGGGSGTVTSVSVVSANGFAGTVATASTTPAITLSTSITGILKGNGTAVSAVTIGTGLSFDGTTLSATGGSSGITIGTTTITSGTNTRILYNNSGVVGEYTLTGSGTVVVMQNTPTLTTPVLNGTVTGTGVSQSSSASTLVQRDANQNIFVNNYFAGTTSTVSAGGTTVLTVASTRTQNITGSSSQTFQLPDATTLTLSSIFEFNNNSSGSLIIANNGGSTQYTVPAGGAVQCFCTSIGSANGTWDFHALAPQSVTWSSGITGLVMNSALTTTPSVASGASSATVPAFLPQRGTTNTGYSGDSTTLYGVIGGVTSSTLTATNLTLPSSLTLGVNATTLGSIKLFGSTSGDVTIKPAAVAGTATVFQLPADNGTNGYVLQTNGSGVTSWVAGGGGGGGITVGTTTITSGTDGRIGYNNAGVYGESSSLFFDDTNLILNVGGGTITGYTPSSTTDAIWATKSANSFFAGLNVQNASAGTTASSDIIAYNDAGTSYINMGIASSGNTDPLYTSGQANSTYIYGYGEKMTIGTGTSGKSIQFITGGTLTANIRMSIDGSGNIGMGTTAPTAQVGIVTNSLGTTQTLTSGLVIENTTAASSGNQQISPALRLSGKGWKTTSTAASQDVSFVMDVLPVQGSTNPAGQFRLRQSVNGGAFTDVFTIASALPTYNFNNSAGQTRWSITDDRVLNGFSGGATLSRGANSASAPNFSFVGDTDNGMYQSGTNALDFSTAGTNALNISSTQNATFAGYVLSKVFVSAKASTPYTVLTTESNANFTNEGASAKIVFNLPTAAANLTYTFIVQDADGIDITANTGDTIRWDTSVTATGGTITSTTIGSTITLVAINATEWVATSIVGTWA